MMTHIFASLDHFVPFAQSNAIPIVGSLVFGFVFLLTLLVTRGFFARDELRRRAIYGTTSTAEAHFDDPRSIQHKGIAESAHLLQRAERFSSESSNSQSKTRSELIKAGFFGARAVIFFYLFRVVLSICLPSCFLLAVLFFELQIPQATLLAGTVGLALFGLLLPSLYVGRQQTIMRHEYERGFPDFMDLLVVCVEAGLGLEAAIERVSRELIGSHRGLAANIHLVSLELRAGKPLSEAMDGLAGRTGIDEVKSLGALLKQSEELGTSLADALKVYSDEMRDKRFSRAEERAHALPVKLVLPLGLFIFPVLMILILLPMVVRMVAAFA